MKLKERARIVFRKLEVDEPPWTGPVVRLGELAVEERVRLGLPAVDRRRSIIEFWKCVNPYCGEYTPRGSAVAGRCLVCFTPRPTSDDPSFAPRG